MSNHARMLTLGTGLLLLSGCSDLTSQQRAWRDEGVRAYERDDDYGRAIQKLTLFLNEVGDRPEAAQALYVRGISYAKTGRRAAAYADLKRSLELADEEDVTWRASFVLGVLHFEDARWQDSGRAYSTALSNMPTDPPMDFALFRLGQCCERTGRWSSAQQAFRRLVEQFPERDLAESARLRLSRRAEHFALQCGAFAVRENADKLLDELSGKGLDTYIRSEVRGHKTLHVVLVGRFVSYEQAEGYLLTARQHVQDARIWP